MARAARKTPTKRRVEPYAQGDLDCLCAIYTIINAVRALCPEMTIGASTRLFRRLIRSLHTHTNDALSPIIIGTNRTLLQKLLAEAQSYIAKRFKVDLDIQPQGRTVNAKSLDVVWDRLSAILDERTVVILELGGCSANRPIRRSRNPPLPLVEGPNAVCAYPICAEVPTSTSDSREIPDRDNNTLLRRPQCALVGVAESDPYQPKKPANDWFALKQIGQLFTD